MFDKMGRAIAITLTGSARSRADITTLICLLAWYCRAATVELPNILHVRANNARIILKIFWAILRRFKALLFLT